MRHPARHRPRADIGDRRYARALDQREELLQRMIGMPDRQDARAGHLARTAISGHIEGMLTGFRMRVLTLVLGSSRGARSWFTHADDSAGLRRRLCNGRNLCRHDPRDRSRAGTVLIRRHPDQGAGLLLAAVDAGSQIGCGAMPDRRPDRGARHHRLRSRERGLEPQPRPNMSTCCSVRISSAHGE